MLFGRFFRISKRGAAINDRDELCENIADQQASKPVTKDSHVRFIFARMAIITKVALHQPVLLQLVPLSSVSFVLEIAENVERS